MKGTCVVEKTHKVLFYAKTWQGVYSHNMIVKKIFFYNITDDVCKHNSLCTMYM